MKYIDKTETIRIFITTKEKLDTLKLMPRESYDALLLRLIGELEAQE